ncbi:MAG: Sec-independent protein translocase protein TatB [Nitrosomonadales bacterium]|nr:Sec-independent protein translocase protein TatB [Nitrosomonadales bacterium]
MFDIAFTELVIVAIVALIVIGPEKLPKVARTLGSLAGRMQRYVATVKHDIERELQLDDLKKLQQDIQQGSQNIKNEVENTIHSGVSDIKQVVDEVADQSSPQQESHRKSGQGRDDQS